LKVLSGLLLRFQVLERNPAETASLIFPALTPVGQSFASVGLRILKKVASKKDGERPIRERSLDSLRLRPWAADFGLSSGHR